VLILFFSVALLWTTKASASTVIVAYYFLGDADPGAAAGALGNLQTIADTSSGFSRTHDFQS
jgi:hypothetical protein